MPYETSYPSYARLNFMKSASMLNQQTTKSEQGADSAKGENDNPKTTQAEPLKSR